MSLIARFKRDIAKHRGRSAVLGVLFVGFVAASVKAVFDLHGPQAAAAAVIAPAVAEKTPSAAPANSGDAEERIAQSKKLWQTLREVKPTAASAGMAFAFDASYYPPPPPDLTKHVAIDPEPVKQAVPPPPIVDEAARHERAIRDQARSLVLKTTAVGNGGSRPMAIINQQLLTIGQEIEGFEITAIRAREVEFVKEGVTVVVKMPEGQ